MCVLNILFSWFNFVNFMHLCPCLQCWFSNKYHFNLIQFSLSLLYTFLIPSTFIKSLIHPSFSKPFPEEEKMFLTFSEFLDPMESCGPGLFHCTSGECIHDVFLCDAAVDCQDSSDETDCNEGMYRLKNAWWCDVHCTCVFLVEGLWE